MRRSKPWVVVLVAVVLAIAGVGVGYVWRSLGDQPVVVDPPSSDVFFPDDLYFTDLPAHLGPKNLLVLIFNYNNGSSVDPDDVVEREWSDYIFGSGERDRGTATINDYYKEISSGRFFFNPVLVGDNETGVYSFHLDKDYSDEQGSHLDWPFFEFLYDAMYALDTLADQGLDISQFSAEGVDKDNYHQVLVDYYDSQQKDRPAQWYATSTVLFIFPTYNIEHVDFTPLSSSLDSFGLYAHINVDSSFGVIAHELGHTLGAIDVYNFGYYASDLMSHASSLMPDPYNVAHINPYYKVIFGWQSPMVVRTTRTITLFPAATSQYQPAIIDIGDPSQYYIIENRQSEGFDTGLTENDADGINVWRIDKQGCEAIYEPSRKGISLEGVLGIPEQSITPQRYVDSNDVNNVAEEDAAVTISYVGQDPYGSITVQITFS